MDSSQIIDLWFHYEQIAMHFNELIIQYRLQLMAGLGAIGALSGYLIGNKVDDVLMQLRLRAYVSTGLLFLFIAASYLDLFYYNELLRGAVKAILKLEAEHPDILYLSTYVKDEFRDGATHHLYITYGLIAVPLFCFVFWSWYTFAVENKKVGKGKSNL